MLQLAVSLGKTTTVEGVETKEHLERVRAAGCTEGLLYQPTETFLGHCGAAAYARREVGKYCIADRRCNVSDAPSTERTIARELSVAPNSSLHTP